MKILLDAMLGTFGYQMIVTEWLSVFLLALLQGTLIGLIVLIWHKKRVGTNSNSANVEKAGIVAGLITLGAGCPTCGTTLLTPLLGTMFSSGGIALAGTLSWVVTVAAVVIAILALKRMGEETYVIIVNERYLRKKEEREKSA